MINGRQILSIVLRGGLKNNIDLAEPPCFDDFTHPLKAAPLGAKKRSWLKLNECERRLAIADWAMEGTDQFSGRNHVLAEDMITAFFLSFEATFQILKEELTSVPNFDGWLQRLSAYTLPVRCLRTIRNFAAHIGETKAGSSLSIPLFPGPSEPFVSRRWALPQLEAGQLDSLKSPKITLSDLPAWETLCAQKSAQELLTQAVLDLRRILEASELLP